MQVSKLPEIGLGDDSASIKVYIANRPPLLEYEELEWMKPMTGGEIKRIADQTGNHWRKVFNVYAKFVCELDSKLKQFETADFSTWQEYRDQRLLQTHSNLALMFSPPVLGDNETIPIVMGKGYFKDLGFEPDDIEGMSWEGSMNADGSEGDFAIWPEKKLIMCPYFDYRQLSNIKIEKLVGLVASLTTD